MEASRSSSIWNVSAASASSRKKRFFSSRLLACELSTKTEQLWHDLFANPSHWWDNRHDKLRPSYPDFRHKISREPLWLNSLRIPSWVLSRLAFLQSNCPHRLLPPIHAHLLHGFHILCQHGLVDLALHVLLDMLHTPTENMYYSLLRACNQVEAPKHVRLVQAHMAGDPLACNGFLGEYLVITLAKCGDVVNARCVFQNLSHRTVFSWTAIISGLTDCGNYGEALKAYLLMRQDGVHPNDHTLVSICRACSSICDLEEGKQIHREVSNFGYAYDLYVATSLINMYGKCGSIELAKSVFDGLRHQNVVSWTAMLSAYVGNELPDTAWQLYGEMQQEGLSPDDRAIVVAVQACCMLAEKNKEAGRLTSMRDVTRGRALHIEACLKGFDSDIFVCNCLISLYGVCETITDAECVFEQMPCHDVVSWNALLSVYVEGDLPKKALQLFRQLKDVGPPSDDRTFVSVLLACGRFAEDEGEADIMGQSSVAAAFEIGRALHSESRRRGLNSDVFVGHTSINMYGKCGSVVEAENAFAGLLESDVVAYNVLSLAYLRQGEGKMVLQIYKKMHEEGVVVNERTFVNALKACCLLAEDELPGVVCNMHISKLSLLAVGKALHDDARRMGFESDSFVTSCLVSMYEKCGSLLEVKNIFGDIWHSSVMACNAMLLALVKHGEGCEALLLFKKMQEKAVSLTNFTFVCALQASIKIANVEECMEIHFAIVSAGEDDNFEMANTLIHAYGCCSSMSDAQAIFDRLSNRDVTSWNALIGAYAYKSNWAASIQWFEKMQETCVKPDNVTFLIVLSACCHTGLVQKCLEYFVSMVRDYNLTPEKEHYSIVVECLGHVGDFARLEDLLASIPVQPDQTTWLCLLGACQVHGNVGLGKLAHNQAMWLQTKQAGCCLHAF